jgi:hypothetical protein
MEKNAYKNSGEKTSRNWGREAWNWMGLAKENPRFNPCNS